MLSTLRARIEELDPRQLRLSITLAAVLSLLPAWMNFGIIATDAAVQYIPPARLFANGDFAAALQQPHQLFSLMIALVAQGTGFSYELSGRLVAAFNFILAVLALFEITHKLSGQKTTALLAAVLLMLNPEFVQRSVDCLKESMLIALVLWGNYFILWPRRALVGRTLGLILLMAGFMLRPTAIYFLLGWLAVWAWHRPDQRLPRIGLTLGVLFSLALLVFLNSDYAPLRSKGIALALVVDWIKLIRLDNFSFAFKVMVIFFATGCYLPVLAGMWGFQKINKQAWRILLGCVLTLALMIHIVMGWLSNRYLLLPLAWFYPAAAIGITVWLQSNRRALRILAILTLISLPLCWAHMAFRAPEPAKLDQKRAGLWLKGELGPDLTVYSNRPRLLFYAEAKAADKPANLAAIDLRADDGQAFTNIVNSTGLKPIKSFGTIKIYQQAQPPHPSRITP